ncbi:CSL zinc finger domain-containing protein [Sarocladium implicatum]|nr:CSL zinc finger domain-containing protein [Sarocladium implicatum]
MAASNPGQPTSQPTHYEVLSLSPDLIASQNDPTAFLKRAYHRALLKNHPDKAKSSSASSSHSAHSIDQITKAWETLSSPRQRAEYDAQLRLSRDSGSGSGRGDEEQVFRTGVENVDLDDLVFDEKTESWSRSCRCGNERGYVFTEDDLLEAGEDGLLMVGCLDCSLWLRVHFAMLDDEDEAIKDTNEKV